MRRPPTAWFMSEDSSPDYCGVGIRGVAMAVDSAVWFLAFLLAGLLVGAVTGDVTTTANGVSTDLEGTPALVSTVLWLALAIGYHALLEWRYGKTAGKHLVAIEVVRADGAPLDLRTSLVRNVFRIVDWLPVLYVVGVVSLLLSDRNARVGDRFADTAVVRP